MRKLVITAIALALCLALAGPAQANLRTRYQSIYEKVDKANAGPYKGGVAGRNIADDGVLTKRGSRPARPAELRASISTMENMLAPPAPAPVLTSSTATVPSTTTATTTAPTTSAPLSAIAACESGGDYSTNTGNGFYGAYQFTQSTWESVGGTGLPSDASPAEQDARAAQLYATAGPGQWPVCGQ